jgi:hypothetical protein
VHHRHHPRARHQIRIKALCHNRIHEVLPRS